MREVTKSTSIYVHNANLQVPIWVPLSGCQDHLPGGFVEQKSFVDASGNNQKYEKGL